VGSKSHTLFHFTDSVETLAKIIRTGFWPRYCSEDFRWYNEQLGYVAYPLVSFCDIPLTRIKDHVGFYGGFGFGMSREWAIRARLNPVIYLSENSALRYSILNLAQPEHFVLPAQVPKFIDHLFELLALIKPLSGKMTRSGGGEADKDFYLENEWRFTPTLPQGRKCIPIQKFEAEQDVYNKYTFDSCLLRFDIKDINYVIVQKEADRAAFLTILNQMEADGEYDGAQLQELRSNVISLERIEKDF